MMFSFKLHIGIWAALFICLKVIDEAVRHCFKISRCPFIQYSLTNKTFDVLDKIAVEYHHLFEILLLIRHGHGWVVVNAILFQFSQNTTKMIFSEMTNLLFMSIQWTWAHKSTSKLRRTTRTKWANKHFHSIRKKVLLQKYKLYTPCPVLSRRIEPRHSAFKVRHRIMIDLFRHRSNFLWSPKKLKKIISSTYATRQRMQQTIEKIQEKKENVLLFKKEIWSIIILCIVRHPTVHKWSNNPKSPVKKTK